MRKPGTDRGRAVAALATALLAALLTVGCGGSSSSAGGAPSTPGPSSSAPPVGEVLVGCSVPGAKAFSAPVPGSDPVLGVIAGTGPVAVVMSYEWGSDPCGWADVAGRVAAQGHRAVLWHYGTLSGLDRVRELQAVVDHVRAAGAGRVVLAGGSLGGCLSMIASSQITPPVDGLVLLSCAVWYDVNTPVATAPWAAKVRVPTLYAVGSDDDPTLVAGVRSEFAAVPAAHKKLIVVDGSPVHGVGLLSDPQVDAAFRDLLATIGR